ncbi:MAG: hypothetical protein QM775_16740 [Pirellulales bacterium]
MSDAATACHRCGRSPCVYQSHAVAAEVVAQPTTTNVYVLPSVAYPQTLVGQGSTVYQSTAPLGFQTGAQRLMDNQALLSQMMELSKARNETGALHLERTTTLYQQALKAESPALEKLAAGQALATVLQAHAPEPAALVIRSASGEVRVERLTTEQTQTLLGKVTDAAKMPPADETETATDVGKYPLIKTFCAKCHGVELAQPSHGVHIGDDPRVAKWMRENFFDLRETVSRGAMPPARAPQPTPAQRVELVKEFESIIRAQKGGSVQE